MHRTATADDKKLQFSLKKLGVNNISGIEEVGLIFFFSFCVSNPFLFLSSKEFDFLQVNMFTNQGTVIHFNNPKVQASLAANTFTITGHAETKQLTEMLPGILNQLGADSLTSLRRLAEALPKQGQYPISMYICWIPKCMLQKEKRHFSTIFSCFVSLHVADECFLFSQLQMEKHQLQQ